jgi:FSR family fosmidomycin resistance protein-like MFS transporter
MLAATFASSVVQPLFGYIFDTRRGEWLLVAGPAVAGLGIGALAFAHTFAAALACVLLGSLGVAAFHPEASKYAAWLSGDRRSTAMSVFSVGGNIGVAVGPLLAGVIASQLGLAGVWLLAIPGVVIAIAQLAGLAALGGATAQARVSAAFAGRDRWGPTALLLVALTVRGYVHFGLLTFIPLLEHDARHNSQAYGSRVLALMLFAGALGTLAAGPLADRHGRRRVLTLSFLAAAPGVALYLANPGVAGLVGIALAGAAVISTFGITIVVSQEYLPRRLSTAAGLSIGLSIGLGGVASFAIGRLADSIGLVDALWTIPPAVLLGAGLCALLPAPDPPQTAT